MGKTSKKEVIRLEYGETNQRLYVLVDSNTGKPISPPRRVKDLYPSRFTYGTKEMAERHAKTFGKEFGRSISVKVYYKPKNKRPSEFSHTYERTRRKK